MAGFRFVVLGGAVGKGGLNAHADVVAVQELLNAHLPDTPHHLTIDGHCGPLTIASIEKAERMFIHSSQPDGRLDPHGPTLHALNHTRRSTPVFANVKANSVLGTGSNKNSPRLAGSKPNVHSNQKPPPGQVAQFSPGSSSNGATAAPPAQLGSSASGEMIGKRSGEITPAAGKAAQDTQRTWKVPASVTLAQFILESGAGHRMPHASNNPFGIKAGRGQPSVMAWTYEFLKDGTRIHILAPFRVFKSIADAFDAHGKLLASHPAYAQARKHVDDADAFARALEGHYSTTKGYGQNVVDKMRDQNLYKYNVNP